MDEIHAGDGLQLARTLMEHQLDVRERLQPRTKARLRLADPFRDRANPAAFKGVEVQDAVGLGEPQRTEHDGLSLVASAPH